MILILVNMPAAPLFIPSIHILTTQICEDRFCIRKLRIIKHPDFRQRKVHRPE
jgi:hypothetical protein